MPRKAKSKNQRKKMENEKAAENNSSPAPEADSPAEAADPAPSEEAPAEESAPSTTPSPAADGPAPESQTRKPKSPPPKATPENRPERRAALDAEGLSEGELKTKITRLEEANADLYNHVEAAQNKSDKLDEKLQAALRDLETARSQLKASEASKTEVTKKANEADTNIQNAEAQTDRTRSLYEQEKKKAVDMQTFAESLNADLEEKTDELKKMRDVASDSEARLRAAERELLDCQAELEQLGPAREMMEVIRVKLEGPFEELGKSLTPDALIAHIDNLEEAKHMSKVPSGVSLNSDYTKAAAHAKGGNRKTSVSDELQKASDQMLDEDEEEKNRIYIEELERKVEDLEKDKKGLQAENERLGGEWKEGRQDSHHEDEPTIQNIITSTSNEEVQVQEAASPKETPPEPMPIVVRVTETQKPSTPSFMDLVMQAPFWLHAVLLICCVLSLWNYYLTWSERRMWLDANDKPWLTSSIYHGYMAQQAASSRPLFTIQPNWFINWIEHDVLGFLETMPG